MKNSEDENKKKKTLIQNAPGGINIGGDNLGSATVNNFGPPQPKPLTVDENQTSAIAERLKPFSGQPVTIFLVGNRSKTQEFGAQLQNALERGGLVVTPATAGMLMREDASPPPPGISICVGEQRMDVANALGTALRLAEVIEEPLHGLKSREPETFTIYISPF